MGGGVQGDSLLHLAVEQDIIFIMLLYYCLFTPQFPRYLSCLSFRGKIPKYMCNRGREESIDIKIVAIGYAKVR